MLDRSAEAQPTLARQPAGRAVFRRRGEPGSSLGVGPSATSAVEVLERVLTSQRSEALLIWPQRPDSVALFHALAVINRLETCDQKGLKTLFFPWSRNTSGIQRTLLVDREFLYQNTLSALGRVHAPRGAEPPPFGYLMALHSLKHILSSGKSDKRFARTLKDDPSLAYPSLFEIVPQCGVLNREVVWHQDQFLRRLRRHTWIGGTQYIEAGTDPARTPFFLFGVHANGAHVRQLRAAGLDPRHRGQRPDLVLIDATRPARERLDGWRQELPRFLGLLSDIYGASSPPVLAVTDDSFALEALRWDVLKKYDLRRGGDPRDKSPVSATVVLSPSPDPLDDRVIESVPIPVITAEAYGTDVLNVVEGGLKLRKALFGAGDRELGEAVSAAMGVAQSLVALPGGSDQLYRFLTDNYEGFERQSHGARFDHLAPIGKMRLALQKGLAGPHHHALSRFLSSFEDLCRAVTSQGAGRKLFDACLHRLAQTNARAIVICSSEVVRGFVIWRVENDETLADVRDVLTRRLLLVDRREAIEALEVADGAHKFEQIVFVEPHPDHLLHVLTRGQLPERVLVLTHLARADQTLRRIRVLLGVPGSETIRPMLAAVQAELERVLQGRIIDVSDFDAEISLPRLGTLDLTGSGASGSGATRLITTSTGLRVRAYDGSEVAVYDPDSLQVFSRKLAKDLEAGDQVCVFSPDFVGMARERLKLTANASDVLALYHQSVMDAAQRLSGRDTASRIVALRERMLAVEPTLDLPGPQALRQWLDVGPLMNAPRDEVRPQAPRDRHTFLCFMKVLGISDAVALHYWNFGIFWTRSLRIRSGFSFHQVFMGLLIDPHGTAAQMPEARRQEVWRIHEMAEQHVTTVVSNDAEVQP
jgi:hypothetical protein